MTRVKVFLFLFWAWITFVAIYIIPFMSARHVIEVSVMPSCVSFLCVFFRCDYHGCVGVWCSLALFHVAHGGVARTQGILCLAIFLAFIFCFKWIPC